MPLSNVTLNFNENGKGAHIRIVIDFTKHLVYITDMSQPFITTSITVLQAHKICDALIANGH